MDFRNAAMLGIEGLEEGYRVIANELNEKVLRIRCPTLLIKCDPLRGGADSFSTACLKIKTAWHYLANRVHPIESFSPWILGLFRSSEKPYFVSIDDPDYEYALTHLGRQLRWTLEDWSRIVVEPVEQYQLERLSYLDALLFKGVSLSDGANHINKSGNDGSEASRETVDRWSSSKMIKATPLGRDPTPGQGRASLYVLEELARDIKEIEKLELMEYQCLLRHFEKVARAPKRKSSPK